MKRDIDLLPQKRASSSPAKTRVIAIGLLIAVLYAALLFVGIKVPTDLKNALQTQSDNLDLELVALEPINIEFDQLAADIEALKQNEQGKIVMDDNPSSEALDLIVKCCPENIMILSINLNGSAIQIFGKADTDELVAQFMLELQRNGFFVVTSISGTSPSAVEKENEEAGEGIDETNDVREFEFYLVYGTPPEPEESEEGGEENEGN